MHRARGNHGSKASSNLGSGGAGSAAFQNTSNGKFVRSEAIRDNATNAGFKGLDLRGRPVRVPNPKSSQTPLRPGRQRLGPISPNIWEIRSLTKAGSPNRKLLDGLLSPELVESLSGSQALPGLPVHLDESEGFAVDLKMEAHRMVCRQVGLNGLGVTMPTKVADSRRFNGTKFRGQPEEKVPREDVNVKGSQTGIAFKPFVLEKRALPSEMHEVAIRLPTIVTGTVVGRVNHLFFGIRPSAQTVVMAQPLPVRRIKMTNGMVICVYIQ